ncbi:class I SAM-dependent methyltransferase [Candidatus Parcubacteria bacterium]|nr:class I SAM-dependent methyltransferase [Candidatus Parcubacteria bacterium]
MHKEYNPQFAEKYSKLVDNKLLKFFRSFRMRELEIKKYIEKNHKIFDCGCGTGYCLDYLKKRGFNQLFGCEVEKNLVKNLDKKYNIKLESITSLSNSYKKDTFDIIIIHDVLHHLYTKEEYNKAVNNLKYVLKPKGYIFIAEPDNNLFWKIMLFACKNFYFIPWLKPTWDGYKTEIKEFDLFFANKNYINGLYKKEFKIIKTKKSFYRSITILQKR